MNLGLPMNHVAFTLISLFFQYFFPFSISFSILNACLRHWKNNCSKQANVYILLFTKSWMTKDGHKDILSNIFMHPLNLYLYNLFLDIDVRPHWVNLNHPT